MAPESLELFDWQREAEERQYQTLRSQGLVFNCTKTGRGKTYMAAVSAKRLGLPAFVVCPKSVITNWHRVLTLAGVPIAGILNWEKLKTGRYGWWDPEKQLWQFDQKVLVIVDEVHRGATGVDSQITEMLAKLKAYPVPKLLLSATLANTPLAMRGTGYLAGLHPWKRHDFYEWCLKMGCVRVQRPGKYGPVTTIELPKRGGDVIMAKLHQAIQDKLVEIREDAPDFPETVVSAKLFDADDPGVAADVRKQYQELARVVQDRSDDPRAIMTRARQRAEIAKVPLLANLTNDAIDEGNSVVLFVNFRNTMDLLQMALGTQRSVQFHGDTKDRAATLELFQSNQVPIFIAQIQAGGVGVDLHDVHRCRPRYTFISPSYSAPDMVQCLGRVHRAGGTKSFQMFVLLADTPEENIYEAIVRKRKNIAALTTGELMGLPA